MSMTIEKLKYRLEYRRECRRYVLKNVRQGLRQSNAGLIKPSAQVRAKDANLNSSSRK